MGGQARALALSPFVRRRLTTYITWYLNVHQGDSNAIVAIVANGAPALPFRPLLCANG